MELQVSEKEEEKIQQENPLDFLPPENLQLAQKILAIELILIKVLENLPTNPLVNFRLVNKTWRKEATSIILKGSKTRMRFSFDSQSKVVGTNCKNGNLSELNECLRKSGGFPCNNFTLSLVPLDDSDLKEFFTLHGSQVKRLHLELDPQHAGKLGHVLINQVPNVQELEIHGNGAELKDIPTAFYLFPKNAQLVHLKSLSYGYFSVAPEIIRVSPKLEKVWIQDFSVKGLEVETLASMHKIHLVKKFSMEKMYQNIEFLELLAAGNPKIEVFYLYPEAENPKLADPLKRRFVLALSKILESSKETMTDLNLRLDEDLLMRVKWPRLEKVEDFNVSSPCHQGSIGLPPNFISQVFPNIRKLQCCGDFVPSLFNCDLPLTQLEKGRFMQYENWNLNNLPMFAPNLRKLELLFIENFPEIAISLWACSGLEELDIKIRLTTKLSSFPRLDMAFTGLEEEMVRKLQRGPDYFNHMKIPGNKKNIPRPNPSILDCPHLTELKIELHGRFFQEQLLMTSVCGEFGFKMLEKLQVEISASNYLVGTLDALKPYARLKTL